MTNERAKEVLQEQIDRYGQEYDAEGIEALETAIKVLEQTSCKSDARRWKRRYLDLKQRIFKMEERTSWIPVSERLPNAYEFVNCTCHSLIDDREDWVIETAYIPQPSYSPYSDWGNIPMLNSGDCKVVAWMHRDIPEPYKAESEDNK